MYGYGPAHGQNTMLTRIFSGDFPRSRLLTALLILIVLYLASAPFLFSGARSLN